MTSDEDPTSGYGLADVSDAKTRPAPDLDYRPAALSESTRRSTQIGLIGTGGISEYHLRAYRALGLRVTALSNRTLSKAQERAAAFYPDAAVYEDYRDLLADESLNVVDITPHPEARAPMIEAALNAGKHVLSQKPFAADRSTALRLADLADERGLLLAVNQNGRWAPHFAWMRKAIHAGLIGRIRSISFNLHWDHSWTAGTPFEKDPHLLLGDFGIHWFDIATVFMGDAHPRSVYASTVHAAGQNMLTPMQAHALVSYPEAQVAIHLSALVKHGQEDRTVIAGEHGTLTAWGPSLNKQRVIWHSADGVAEPLLEGDWFSHGFQGTMAELLQAREVGRQPLNSARSAIRSLTLMQEALTSSQTGQPTTCRPE